ncbi:MAG: A/G-specific adenine glycosylase [Chlamydiales bacterium]|nr:A/G-specific adenine glycosylase [Chlamydiales bacterium]
MTYALSLDSLKNWFLQHKRDFPWRQNPTPYQVWISEVMLQQTQALRVVDFYRRWMRRFPTLIDLAQAPLDDVLKVWEGLGYYSRARTLHAAAKDIVTRFGGAIPEDADSLASIKGLGPYTVGAIRSFAFHKKHPAVDANVARVLARLFALSDDISKAKTLQKFREVALHILPDHEPHILAEALIELGASICKKNPDCAKCPLKNECLAHQQNMQNAFPVKSQKTIYESLYRDVAVVVSDGHLLLSRKKKGKASTGLYEFPYFESISGGKDSSEIQASLQEMGINAHFEAHLDEEKQSFTRYRIALYPKLFYVSQKDAIKDHEWCDKSTIELLTFSSGHKRILQSLDDFFEPNFEKKI